MGVIGRDDGNGKLLRKRLPKVEYVDNPEPDGDFAKSQIFRFLRLQHPARIRDGQLSGLSQQEAHLLGFFAHGRQITLELRNIRRIGHSVLLVSAQGHTGRGAGRPNLRPNGNNDLLSAAITPNTGTPNTVNASRSERMRGFNISLIRASPLPSSVPRMTDNATFSGRYGADGVNGTTAELNKKTTERTARQTKRNKKKRSSAWS